MKWLMKTTEGFIRYADKVIVVAPSIKHHLENLGIRSELVRMVWILIRIIQA